MAQKLHTNQNDWQSHLLRLEGAYAPATIRAYYDDVRSFVDWCGRRRLESFPARVETVCAFVEDQGSRLVPTTVRRRVGAIGKFHRLMSLPDPTRDEEVRISMRRIVRSRRLPPQQARGLSRDQLSEVLAVQPETGWGLRDRAILALGFEMLARRSEIVALRDGDLEWRADGTLRVTIRRSKTDQAGMGRFVFTSRQTARVVSEWIVWRGVGFEFLFCPIYQDRCVVIHKKGRAVVAALVERLEQLPPRLTCAIDQHRRAALILAPARSTATEVLMDGKSILRLNNPVAMQR